MYWARFFAVGLALTSYTAWGATLTWNANTEVDLAGYRVYQCSALPCGRANGTATPLATLGNVTSFNIGTPAVVQYYVVTAYDFANNESSESNVTTYTPATSTPPPPTPTPTPTPPPVTPPPPPASTPAIGASPLTLLFTAQQGSSNPATQTLIIGNIGGGTLNWSAGENSSWLTLSPASGVGNGSVIIAVTTGTRAAGTYSASITLNATGAAPVTIPVTLAISAPPGTPLPSPPPIPTGLQLTTVR